ncbi:GAF domain-containing SpoIIE family protein phosphatase [Aureibacter tunicatorum]|uniref:Serine phosphatase RsbU (Regulator of sigma subunit) n=1 Tax=Aureibacter tunicatorum TaxID=866807 RepID=A0AAE4BRE5_9BACT|nr:SpoIIE family protein phosphatase [Aureibacter tunicatorum]MDR6240129.1 serine phosphatase RsbU (regulator of sigma subunit) [Aureibacter tunicatorum]
MGSTAWMAMLFSDLLIVFSNKTNAHSGISDQLPNAFLAFFIFFVYLFFRFNINRVEGINIIDLLWRVFVTGLTSTVASLLIKAFMFFLGNSILSNNELFLTFLYYTNIGFIIIFQISTFIVWKKLILYQKTKKLIRLWYFFEYSLFISLFLVFIKWIEFSPIFYLLITALFIVALVLSANLKWVAYLDYKQKWRGILLILLIIIYQLYFFVYMIDLGADYETFMHVTIFGNVGLVTLSSFTFIYALFALLVILFNLPTTSVFEQKLAEVVNFNRLSQTRNAGKNEEEIYDILLDSSVSAVLAAAAWIETYDEDGALNKIFTYEINAPEITDLQNKFDKEGIQDLFSSSPSSLKPNRYMASIDHHTFKSLLVYPVVMQQQHIATLYLIKDVSDGFNREMLDIVKAFADQASISVENYRLIHEAIANERYKEELKIAKRVHDSLLPTKLVDNDKLTIKAYSKAAADVGGDYYDTFQISDNKWALIIGDVSGKGTSAAFHMAEMKGVFQSLAQLDMCPKDFMNNANKALSRCLDRASFITASYYVIDTESNTISFSRAGHCPTLYYDSQEKSARYYESKGMGLGILRNSMYEDFVYVNTVSYSAGDMLYLYTDGLTEAKNNTEEFGYERLKDSFEKHVNEDLQDILHNVVMDVHDFCGAQMPDDDYTAILVKFH